MGRKKTSAKRILAAALLVICIVSVLAVSAAAETTTGQLVRYVPTTITVTPEQTEVEGYFVNMNENSTVQDFEDLEITLWSGKEQLASGSFGDISIMIRPHGCAYRSFVFEGSNGLTPGTYDCDEEVYASLNASFTVVK